MFVAVSVNSCITLLQTANCARQVVHYFIIVIFVVKSGSILYHCHICSDYMQQHVHHDTSMTSLKLTGLAAWPSLTVFTPEMFLFEICMFYFISLASFQMHRIQILNGLSITQATLIDMPSSNCLHQSPHVWL